MITKPKGECRPHAPPCNKAANWSRRYRARRPACILAIEPLIDIVREINYAVADGERAAAILVSARANAKSVSVVGRDAFRLPVRADAVDESSSLLLGLSLAPIDCVAVQRDLFEADGVADDEVGGYGRRPKAIGAGGHASRPFWRSAQNGTRAHAPQANCSTASLTTSARLTKPIATRAEWLQWSAIQPCIAVSPGGIPWIRIYRSARGSVRASQMAKPSACVIPPAGGQAPPDGSF